MVPASTSHSFVQSHFLRGGPALLAGLVLGLSACGGSEPATQDSGAADATVMDAGPPVDSGPADTGVVDTGVVDTGVADTGVEPDAGPTDTGIEPDAGTNFPTLSDYRLCQIDTDCPVGLGRCVKELSLNRADQDGLSVVVLSDVDTRVPAGQGVCSETCTQDLSACETLSLKDSTGTDVPFTCQVLTLGASPYPATPPAFPFDVQLDPAEMVLGQPFGALCRPPFELDAAHISNFCGACDSEGGCADGTCWNFATQTLVQTGDNGTCLELNPGSCPIGFEARSLMDGTTDLGEHCVPAQETCGLCQDRDGDQWGAGHCLNVQVDCDDRNPAAYYDNLDPEHAFPTYCGGHDYNCNGLSDDVEQVGIDVYKASHCEYCGDDADGRTVNAGTSAEATLACVAGVVQVANCADAAQVHCSGDPRLTGCEATAAAGGQTFYRDGDGDTYGDLNTPTLGCPGGGAPNGFVVDSTDCDDTDIDVHPNVPDICDCWGDCAQAGAQVDNDCDNSVDEDVTAYSWGTDGDGDGVAGTAFDTNTYCGAPAANLVLGDGTEDCNDGSGASYGAHTRITDASGAILSFPLTASPARDASGNLYTLAVNPPAETCDGEDNDCVNGIDDGVLNTYYYDQDGDQFGHPTVSMFACSAPTDFVVDNTDCNDSEITIYPGAPELCDGIDRDCMIDGDALVPLGGSCTTALLGNCSAGTQTACVNAAFVCTQVNQPGLFDDPHNLPDDEDCDGPEAVIYVDPSGDDNNVGSAAAPMATLAEALDTAEADGATQIHMLSGSHATSTQTNLVSGIDIVGGFSRAGNIWTAGGGQSLLLHDGTASGDRAVVLLAAGTNTTVAYLDVQLVTSALSTGVNHYGVFAFAADNLRLIGMTITVESSDGADGADGADGVSGPPSSPGFVTAQVCDGITVSGGVGGRPTAGAPGEFGSGENPGAFGNPAGHGGASSSPATSGSASRPQVGSLLWSSSVNEVAATDGRPGSGGGGGFAVGLAIGGSGGGGGCGGQAGENGQTGGSAFGIFSRLSEGMSIDGLNVTVAGGGDGGNGGNGGGGGDGGAAGLFVILGNGIAVDGGSGSGGGGGGGGAAGFGGHAYPIFHQGATDLCSSASLTNVVRNITGTAGLAGARGTGGSAGVSVLSNLDGPDGTSAAVGFQVDCYWSAPCTGATCSNGDLCSGGYCQP